VFHFGEKISDLVQVLLKLITLFQQFQGELDAIILGIESQLPFRLLRRRCICGVQALQPV
jgi:hypothetical protein